ncbi:MAG: hypothetical protein ACI9JY_003013 [Saprospiraceae bacterium]
MQYNQDKRDGKIGVAKKIVRKVKPVREKGGRNDRRGNNRNRDDRNQTAKPAPTPKAAAPAPATKPAPAAPVAKDEEE